MHNISTEDVYGRGGSTRSKKTSSTYINLHFIQLSVACHGDSSGL